MSLRQHIAITFFAKYLELGLSLISSIVLARLLTPEDFGIYSIAASIVLIGYLFRNFGVGQYIVQADTIHDDMLRAAFALTLLVSWGIGLLLALMAPFAGEFYQNDGVAQVLWFLALNFLLLPFGAIADAVLRRNLAFEKLAVITVASALVAAAVSIVSAWYGARYLAIAWGGNAGTLTTIVFTLYFRPKNLPWFPSFRGLREILGFGFKVGMLDLVNRGSDSATEMAIGKAHGLHDLGIYSRAYGAFMLFEYAFLEGIKPVVLPYLSEAKRGKGELGDIYLRVVSYATAFMLPFFAFLSIAALDVLRVLYGEQWDEAAPLLRVMCMAGVLLSVTVFFDQLLIAKSRPGQALSYQIMAQGVRLTALALLLMGELWMAALALVVGAGVRAFLVVRLAREHLAIETQHFIERMAPAMMVAMAVAAAVIAVQRLFDLEQPGVLRLLVISSVAILVWLLGLFALRHPLAREIRRLSPIGGR